MGSHSATLAAMSISAPAGSAVLAIATAQSTLSGTRVVLSRTVVALRAMVCAHVIPLPTANTSIAGDSEARPSFGSSSVSKLDWSLLHSFEACQPMELM